MFCNICIKRLNFLFQGNIYHLDSWSCLLNSWFSFWGASNLLCRSFSFFTMFSFMLNTSFTISWIFLSKAYLISVSWFNNCLKISSFDFQGHLIATVSSTSVVKGRKNPSMKRVHMISERENPQTKYFSSIYIQIVLLSKPHREKV